MNWFTIIRFFRSFGKKIKNIGLHLLIVFIMMPAVLFWSSVVFRLALGTDYFFDVFISRISNNFVGGVFLVLCIVFLPALSVGISLIEHKRYSDSFSRWESVVGIIFLLSGLFASFLK